MDGKPGALCVKKSEASPQMPKSWATRTMQVLVMPATTTSIGLQREGEPANLTSPH